MTAIALINPKYVANLAAAVRAASCFGATQVRWTGARINMLHERLPRELRGRLYPEVEIVHDDLYTYVSESDLTPVAVEMVPSEPLTTFVHPENALYVFGPEDGHLGKAILSHCHRVVHIPSNHCLNLAGAIYVTLYDRLAKQ